MKLVRNTGADRVIDLLRPGLAAGRQLDVVIPDFSLFAFSEMMHELAALAGCRLAARILRFWVRTPTVPRATV